MTDRKPNIVLILTDDHRFDTSGALDNPNIQTPDIDELVRRGRAFTQAGICFLEQYTATDPYLLYLSLLARPPRPAQHAPGITLRRQKRRKDKTCPFYAIRAGGAYFNHDHSHPHTGCGIGWE